MLIRKDGTSIIPENLTDEDIKLSRWNILEYLDSEAQIIGHLEAVLRGCHSEAGRLANLLKKPPTGGFSENCQF
jgi:hypothetical protein